MLESELESEGVEHSDAMASLNLRRQLSRLAKEEEELEWELTDYGWKVDRIAHVIYRAEEERSDLLTQLGQVPAEERADLLTQLGQVLTSVAVTNSMLLLIHLYRATIMKTPPIWTHCYQNQANNICKDDY